MRLSIELPDDLHRDLKAKAATEGKTITDIVRPMLVQFTYGTVPVVAPPGNATPARADVSLRRGRMSGSDLSKSAQAQGKTRR